MFLLCPFNIQSVHSSGSRPKWIARAGLTAFLLLLWQLLAFSQAGMIIYDGLTGIHDVSVQNDTAIISTLIPGSPADKAGVWLGDQIIAINDSVVAGTGLKRRDIRQLLKDRSGTAIELKIIRKGEENPLCFVFHRDPYLYQIDSYDFVYLVDSLEQWDIQDIMSDSMAALFKDPLEAKITVYSVEKGSPAERNGILPGDQLISLADELDKDNSYHISYKRLNAISPDTTIAILRDSSLIYYFLLEPSLQGDLMGIKSQFERDFSFPCVWMRITTENRLSTSRTYLFNIPEMKGKDSLNFFHTLPSGELIEKKAGILLPTQDRDFIYKNWRAVKVMLNKGEKQTFYFRWKAEDSVEGLHFQIYALDTIVRFDRFERMVLYGFMFTMLIISAFFLLLFAVIKGRQYLYFALYTGSLVVFLFITDGYLDEYFWKENNLFLKFLEKYQPYIMSWISIFFLLFGIAYLELRKFFKYWYRSVVIVLSLTAFRILLVLIEAVFNLNYPAFIDHVFTVVWILTVGVIPLFILIIPAIIRGRNGFRPAWYFLAANLVLIPLIYVTIYSSLYSNTVISIYESIFSRLFISSGMHIAAILQILIFSFGIARKMRLDEIERIQIQEQIIDQLKVNEKLKDRVNRELEQKVKERTREITDSIDYAQRIQDAVLPGPEFLDQIMSEYLVLYKPKDVVSGDFYWIKELNNSLIVVAADCTGHGVPGAFMSMLGITLLDEQMGSAGLDDPAEILENLRSKVKELLAQKGHKEEQKDGMDMAIAIIDKKKKTLQFAGAHNSLYLIRGSSQISQTEPGLEASVKSKDFHLFELKGDKQPIGVYWEETKFSTHRLSLMDQDALYVFTDGFIDQFGGGQRKKYKSHRFKELLLSIQNEPMDKQKKLLEKAFESWRGDVEQIDDVCVIGVRIG
jgi:serine phosphatase RsbU (regulator of sigma subunit)